ncbi:hypothetical protein [Glycomyces xiaoerkulensis]|uniref:hypothetical protein n=1 Tax=Glycomyces xiaoerkulensis TaxID=2038139 RepID=UPI000C269B6C|nr:hypothetical protein [Glycomyces xiaoerkulensis]
MSYQGESADDFEEISEFDLADSADESDEERDPEEYVGDQERAVPEEADVADAVDQALEVPADEDGTRED